MFTNRIKRMIIVFALTFTVFHQVGTSAVATSPGTDTEIQQISTDESSITQEITEKALAEIDLLAVDFQGDVGGFGFVPDAFTAPFTAQVSVSANTLVYPDDPAFAESYPAANVTPIGPLVTLQVPYRSLTRNDDPAQKIVVASPVLYRQYQGKYEPTDPVVVEVRILRPDGSQDFSLEDYVAGGRIILLGETIDAAFAGSPPPETLTISFQPVDYGATSPGQGELNPSDVKS